MLESTLNLLLEAVFMVLLPQGFSPYSTHDRQDHGTLMNGAIALLLCLQTNAVKRIESRFPGNLATADKNPLKVLEKPVGDFWGCVNLSKLRKQGNLA